MKMDDRDHPEEGESSEKQEMIKGKAMIRSTQCGSPEGPTPEILQLLISKEKEHDKDYDEEDH